SNSWIFNNVILGACFGVFLFFGRNKITQLQALIFFICGDPSVFRPWLFSDGLGAEATDYR
ncbi:hypothetical protein, partial [Aliiglaciecola aliphaticivorans]